MVRPPATESGLRPWHRLVEHYTPDGPLGRLLLAAVAGSVGGTGFLLAIWSVVASASFFWLVTALLGSAFGFAGVALTLVVLWPVYLSLIGNVESASAYPESAASRSSTAGDGGDSDDAVELLKRRYAAGEIPEAEFERRLDDLLDLDAALASTRDSPRRREDIREPERS